MIRTLLFRPGSRETVRGAIELLATWRAEPDSLLWLDLADEPTEAERQLLTGSFGLHPLAVQDAQRARHQPKIESFEGHAFLLLKGMGPDAPGFEFETIQIAMFIGTRFFVTRHSGPSPSIDRLWQEQQDDAALLASGPDALALRLSRILIDRYLGRLLALEPRLEDLERDIVAAPRDDMLAELIGYKTDLRKFRRVLRYHVEVFAELTSRPPPQVAAERMHDIKDVYEHQERVSGLATLYYEVASDLIDGYISLASHRLNNIMKVLTIVTAVFVPLSFLAGIYGMNFENMPELKSRNAYFILLGAMATIAVCLLLLFRRRRWI